MEATLTQLPDPDEVNAVIRAATVAEILPRFQKLTKSEIHEKEPGQLVTDADIAAELMLTDDLVRLYPGAVVGEEAVARDPSLLDVLTRPGVVWVVDPVDGTGNFAGGDPRFAVIVALVVDGRTVMGWIHDPVPNRTVFAKAGHGAWADGQRLQVLGEDPVSAMRGSYKRTRQLKGRVAEVGRRGSAAHDYLDMVFGRLHFAHFRKLMPWDHAAGVLIHAEAGGYGRLMDGSDYHPVALPDSTLLLAPGGRSWAELKALIAATAKSEGKTG